MKIVNVERGSGKTAYLIKRSARENKPILTTSVLRARHLLDKAHDMGYVIPEPLAVVDIAMHKYAGREDCKNGILVDDFDEVFSQLMSASFGLSIDTVTASIDKQETIEFEIEQTLQDFVFWMIKNFDED